MRRLEYSPGLDGLRAVSVAAVFLFHAGVLSGGFIGVDVFFVISGFLITSLAVSEIETTGRLALGAFWARRARRLLPALLAAMSAAVVYSAVVGGAALRRIGDDVLATTFYVANWAQIGEGRDYFAQYESEPLLEHAWSLSVEEQFYVIWPILIVGLSVVARHRQLPLRKVIGITAGLAALASFATAVWLRDIGGASLTRLYYGTDTRAVGLAAGALLGAMATPALVQPSATPSAETSTGRNAVGAAALAGLVAISLFIDGSQAWLYGPGFLLIAVLSVAVIVTTLHGGWLARCLAVAPLATVGRVSYGVYLWHWPVIVVLDGERTGASGLALGMLWVAVTAVLTAASWFLIERRAPLPSMRRPSRVLGYISAAAVIGLGAVVVSDRAIDRSLNAEYSIPAALADPGSQPTTTRGPVDAVPTTTATATVPATRTATTTTIMQVPVEVAATTTLLTVPATRPLRLLLVGDSVAHSLRNGADSIPAQEIFEVPGFGPVDVLNQGTIGCSVIAEGAMVYGDTLLSPPTRCRGEERFVDDVEQFDPDVVVTLFGWPGTGNFRFDDGGTAGACDERFDAAWLNGYQTLLDRLATNRPAVAFNVAPMFEADEEEEQRTRCLNALVDQLDAPVFDLQEWLCPDYDCTSSASLRPDGLHFRNSGQLQRDVTISLIGQVLPLAGY